MSEHTEPCGMWVRLKSGENCNRPATMGFQAEEGGIVPMCDECIRITGTKRANLHPLRAPTTETPDHG